MKTVCKTNIKNALRRSWDTNDFEEVNDDWAAWVERKGCNGFQAVIFNYETGQTWRTPKIWALSMTECIRMATAHLLDCYEHPEDAVIGRAGLNRAA